MASSRAPEASTSSSAPGPSSPAGPTSPVAIVCVGMAGAGKSTFMQRINSHLHANKEPPYVINLDPAVLSAPFQSNIDIRESVNYQEVMKQYNLGPNGGILTSLNLFATKIDQVLSLLEKRAAPDPSDPTRKPIQKILVDTPGQIEVFVWSASGTIILESLASSFPTVIAYIIDTPRSSSTSTFMSNMLYACSILYKTKLPMVLVLNKTDVQDASFAQEWMRDFSAFQEALQKDEEANAFGGVEGGDSVGGTGYMASLLNSMGLVLDEFYQHLSVVAVSSRTGMGIDEFFVAVNEKADEFRRDYQPELDRKRKEREAGRFEARDKEVEKMMQGMTVDPTRTKVKLPTENEDEDGAHAQSDNDDDADEDDNDDNDDDMGDDEMDRDGLQARYTAAMVGEEDSVLADASFAKYLHKQRQ